MKTKGIIPVNKPMGWTSFDVCNKLKSLVRPQKIGHLGTLDPMATGVLLVTVGKATKLFDCFQEKEKTYVAEFEFGYLTNTLDATGEIKETTNVIPTRENIQKILPEFVGTISQIPPKYSAKSVNGKRAYDLARKNIDFELKPKKVEIYSLEIVRFEDNKLTLNIKCGSGTYVRSIGRDIAEKLNSFATMTKLIRTAISDFTLKDCYDIEMITKDNIDQKIVPVNSILNYPIITLNEKDQAKILNGQTLRIEKADGEYKLNGEFDTIAIVKIKNFNAKMSLFLG